MDDRIQYKLFNLEITPPAEAWEGIESALNNERSTSLLSRFQSYEVEPPAGVWLQISQTLSGLPEKETAPVRRISFRRMAAAAVVIGLIATGSYYFLFRDAEAVPNVLPVTASVLPPEPKANEEALPTEQIVNSPARAVKRLSTISPVIHLSDESPALDIPKNDKEPVKLNTATPIATNEIQVPAPPILDSEGKPLIDYQLLVSRDKNYISVTSPNGQQTRISSKFLPILTYLSGHSNLSSESSKWTVKFAEWKKKLLEDPNFIPAAGNYLDLLELPEIFDEQ